MSAEVSRQDYADRPSTVHLHSPETRALVAVIREGLVRDGQVRLHNFGTFRIKWSKPHNIRHPRTGETIVAPAQPRVVFTPAAALRDTVEPNPRPVVPFYDNPKRGDFVLAEEHDLPAREGADDSAAQESVAVSAAETVVTLPPEDVDRRAVERAPDGRLALVGAGMLLLALVPAVLYLLQKDIDESQLAAPDTISSAQAVQVDTAPALNVPVTIPGASSEPDTLVDDLPEPPAAPAADVVAAAGAEPLAPSAEPSIAPVQQGRPAAEAPPRPEPAGDVAQAVGEAPEPAMAEQAIVQAPSGRPGTQTDVASAPVAAAGPGPEPETASPERQPSPGPVTPGEHRVHRGDSLWRLAEVTYGNGMLWPVIYQANRGELSDPNLIEPGQVLRIPVREPGAEAAFRTQVAEGYFQVYRYLEQRSASAAKHFLIAAVNYDAALVQARAAEIAPAHQQFIK